MNRLIGVLYLFNGILFINKKEWNTDTSYNMDEPLKHYDKWKKPVTEDHILFDSIYMKCPEQAILQEQKVD